MQPNPKIDRFGSPNPAANDDKVADNKIPPPPSLAGVGSTASFDSQLAKPALINGTTPPPLIAAPEEPHPAPELLADITNVLRLLRMAKQAKLALERFNRATRAFAATTTGGGTSEADADADFTERATEATTAYNVLLAAITKRLGEKRAEYEAGIRTVTTRIEARVVGAGFQKHHAVAVVAAVSVGPLRQLCDQILAENGWDEANLLRHGSELQEALSHAQTAAHFKAMLSGENWAPAAGTGAVDRHAQVQRLTAAVEHYHAARCLQTVIADLPAFLASLQQHLDRAAALEEEVHAGRLFGDPCISGSCISAGSMHSPASKIVCR